MPRFHLFDETTTGTRTPGPDLQSPAESLTLGDLIELRVREEIRGWNETGRAERGWIVPQSEVERALNGPRRARTTFYDPDDAVALAHEAFRKGRYLVLLPEGQAESLEQRVTLNEGDEIVFLRMVPLIGG